MPYKTSISTDNRLLHELAVAEKALIEAHAASLSAERDFQIAARKYAAVRSLATDLLGYSPYHEDAIWDATTSRLLPPKQRGSYRFLDMKPREAILAALAEVDSEMTLEQVHERLKSGGLDLGMRAINAAMMRTAGVAKTARGSYKLTDKVRRTRAA